MRTSVRAPLLLIILDLPLAKTYKEYSSMYHNVCLANSTQYKGWKAIYMNELAMTVHSIVELHE